MYKEGLLTDEEFAAMKKIRGKQMTDFKIDTIGEFIIFIVGTFIFCLIVGFVILGLVDFAFWDINFSGGSIFAIAIIAFITIIFLLKKYNKNHITEEERVKKILDSRSIHLEEKIIKRVISLKKNKKQLFCKVYNIPSNKNEDILEFIAKNWAARIEMNHLYSSLSFINGGHPKNNNFSSLKNSMPKSLIHKVMVRDNYICQKCGKNIRYEYEKEKIEWTGNIDLIKPLSEGGTLTEDNLIVKCFDCRKNEGFN